MVVWDVQVVWDKNGLSWREFKTTSSEELWNIIQAKRILVWDSERSEITKIEKLGIHCKN